MPRAPRETAADEVAQHRAAASAFGPPLPPEVIAAQLGTGPGAEPMENAAKSTMSFGSAIWTVVDGIQTVANLGFTVWMLSDAVQQLKESALNFIFMLTMNTQMLMDGARRMQEQVAAFRTARASIAPLEEVEANRTELATLEATNYYGQNDEAIDAVQRQYQEMSDQNNLARDRYIAETSFNTEGFGEPEAVPSLVNLPSGGPPEPDAALQPSAPTPPVPSGGGGGGANGGVTAEGELAGLSSLGSGGGSGSGSELPRTEGEGSGAVVAGGPELGVAGGLAPVNFGDPLGVTPSSGPILGPRVSSTGADSLVSKTGATFVPSGWNARPVLSQSFEPARLPTATGAPAAGAPTGMMTAPTPRGPIGPRAGADGGDLARPKPPPSNGSQSGGWSENGRRRRGSSTQT